MNYTKQNDLLLDKLKTYYESNHYKNLDRILKILNGDSIISLRILDWFVTNYAKKNYIVYTLSNGTRFKVYNDYKLKLKAYAKRRFDPFCRWERITVPYNGEKFMETTIGQLNFFKWAIENKIVDYIETNYAAIEQDMNARNSTSKTRSTIDSISSIDSTDSLDNTKTRKRREELSVSACKCIKKETVNIIVKFH
jgi:hypothetical protein